VGLSKFSRRQGGAQQGLVFAFLAVDGLALSVLTPPKGVSLTGTLHSFKCLRQRKRTLDVNSSAQGDALTPFQQKPALIFDLETVFPNEAGQ